MAIEIDLEGRIALVTGGGRGIGRAVAVSLAAAGADVCVTARTRSQLEKTVEAIEDQGRKAIAICADATDKKAVDGVVGKVIRDMGGLHLLINNAGTRLLAPLTDTGEDAYDRLMDTNVKSMYLFTKAAGMHFIGQNYGRVVNMASVGAFVTSPNQAIYSAGKAAVAQFTKAMAIEWARYGIRVNAVAPGWIKTQMIEDLVENRPKLERYLKAIPQRRLGTPDDIGPMAAFLCSDLSAYMTGTVVVIDGGLMIP